MDAADDVDAVSVGCSTIRGAGNGVTGNVVGKQCLLLVVDDGNGLEWVGSWSLYLPHGLSSVERRLCRPHRWSPYRLYCVGPTTKP